MSCAGPAALAGDTLEALDIMITCQSLHRDRQSGTLALGKLRELGCCGWTVGQDSRGKHKFIAPDNIAIRMTEPLAGTATDGSAAAEEETVCAGAGAGAGTGPCAGAGAGAGADAGANQDKAPAHWRQDRETDLKVNSVVLLVVCFTAAANAPLSGGSAGCS